PEVLAPAGPCGPSGPVGPTGPGMPCAPCGPVPPSTMGVSFGRQVSLTRIAPLPARTQMRTSVFPAADVNVAPVSTTAATAPTTLTTRFMLSSRGVLTADRELKLKPKHQGSP